MGNYFEALNALDVSGKTEKKNGLTYLSWAFAWGELKKRHPASYFTIYENEHGWPYFTDGRTCWVKTGVTVVLEDGTALEHIEYLPVMDHRNQSIPAERVTSFDVNKSIQRSLTKAVARHGLGLYIYAGEDLPEGADDPAPTPQKKQAAKKAAPKAEKAEPKQDAPALLASNEQKKAILGRAKALGVDVPALLADCGWKEGEKLTAEQAERAEYRLGEIEKSRAK